MAFEKARGNGGGSVVWEKIRRGKWETPASGHRDRQDRLVGRNRLASGSKVVRQ